MQIFSIKHLQSKCRNTLKILSTTIKFQLEIKNVIHYVNRLRDKKHMIISLDAKGAFGEIHHPFVRKFLENLGIQKISQTYLSIIVYAKEFIKLNQENK